MMRRAFTLVEMIIYMGIFSIMLVVLTQVFEATLDLYIESTTNSSISRENTYLSSRLAYDVRRASAIQLPLAAGETGSVLQLLVGGDTFSYQLSNGRLVLSENGTADELTGNEVTVQDFSATRTGEGVQVGWTLVSGEASQSYLTTVSLR